MTKVIFFLGKPGSGKGTQIKYLEENTGYKVIRTGELLRLRSKKEDYIGQKIEECLDKGALIPTPMVFLIWMPLLFDFQENKARGVIFDGNPRKLYEAQMLEEVFDMFDWSDISVIYLNISDQEAHERLSKRKRSDDNKEDIMARLKWFQEEVVPVISYYESKGKLIQIDGERSIEEIKDDISKKIQ